MYWGNAYECFGAGSRDLRTDWELHTEGTQVYWHLQVVCLWSALLWTAAGPADYGGLVERMSRWGFPIYVWSSEPCRSSTSQRVKEMRYVNM